MAWRDIIRIGKACLNDEKWITLQYHHEQMFTKPMVTFPPTFLPPRPHSVKEACILLSLSVGSAILLRNLLKESMEEEARGGAAAGDPPPESALNELGVYCLAPCDVLILLNLRAFWPGQ